MGLEMLILLPRSHQEGRWGSNCRDLNPEEPWNRVSEGQMGLEMLILIPGGHWEGR